MRTKKRKAKKAKKQKEERWKTKDGGPEAAPPLMEKSAFVSKDYEQRMALKREKMSANRDMRVSIRVNKEILAADTIDEVLGVVEKHNEFSVVNIATACQSLANLTPTRKIYHNSRQRERVRNIRQTYVGDKRFEKTLLGLVMRKHDKMEPRQVSMVMRHLATISGKCGYCFPPELWRGLDGSVRRTAPLMDPRESAWTFWAYGRLFDLGEGFKTYLSAETLGELTEAVKKHAAEGLSDRIALCNALWAYVRILEQSEGQSAAAADRLVESRSGSSGIECSQQTEEEGGEEKEEEEGRRRGDTHDFGPIDREVVNALSEAMMMGSHGEQKQEPKQEQKQKQQNQKQKRKSEPPELSTWMLATVMRAHTRLYDAGQIATVSDEMARALLAATESLAPKMASWHAELARSLFFRFALESQVSPALNEALNEAMKRETPEVRNLRRAKEARAASAAAKMEKSMRRRSNSRVSVLGGGVVDDDHMAQITAEMVAEVAQAEHEPSLSTELEPSPEPSGQTGRRSLFTASDVAAEQAAVEALAQRWFDALPTQAGERLIERLDRCGSAADVERLLFLSVSDDNTPIRALLRAKFLRAVERMTFKRMHQMTTEEAGEGGGGAETLSGDDDGAAEERSVGGRLRFMTAEEFTSEIYSQETR